MKQKQAPSLKIIEAPADYRPNIIAIAKDEYEKRGGRDGLRKRASQRQAKEEERAVKAQKEGNLLAHAVQLLNTGQFQQQVEQDLRMQGLDGPTASSIAARALVQWKKAIVDHLLIGSTMTLLGLGLTVMVLLVAQLAGYIVIIGAIVGMMLFGLIRLGIGLSLLLLKRESPVLILSIAAILFFGGLIGYIYWACHN